MTFERINQGNRAGQWRAVPAAERRVCLKRASGYVFEQDKRGDYTVAVYDPLASVISYLRDESYFAFHTSSQIDLVRTWGLKDAIDLCNGIANR
jgi:hypothetical protein